MYLINSLKEGLGILCFDKETITKVSKERSLEEIFLSTLFVNYVFVLIIYIIGVILGGYSIQGRELNMPVFFGLLMVYPFAFNLVVYFIYGIFGVMADLIDRKNHVKPLLSVGFHTAIVYSIIMYIVAVVTTYNLNFGGFLAGLFMLYFLYTMFLSLSTVYKFSFGQTLIVLFTPFLLLGIVILLAALFYPEIVRNIIIFFLA